MWGGKSVYRKGGKTVYLDPSKHTYRGYGKCP